MNCPDIHDYVLAAMALGITMMAALAVVPEVGTVGIVVSYVVLGVALFVVPRLWCH